MFNKTSKSSRQAAAAPVPVPPLPDLTQSKKPAPAASGPKVASMLASDLTFEGNISGSGDLHIDGTVKGDIRVGRLTVGETGNVDGGVQADHVEVRGRIVGAIHAKQVKLMSTAYVDGDIIHDQLAIDVGAYFQGRCLQGRKGDASESSVSNLNAPAAAEPILNAAPESADTGQLIELKPAQA